jgi:hypothetical protein
MFKRIGVGRARATDQFFRHLREMTLAMIIPRSMPGWVSQDDFDAMIRRALTERLPWDYDAAEWK